MKNCEVCLWRSPPLFNSQECEGMRSRMLAFEASGIDHVGLIQICFSQRQLFRVSAKKQSTCFDSISTLSPSISPMWTKIRIMVKNQCGACWTHWIRKLNMFIPMRGSFFIWHKLYLLLYSFTAWVCIEFVLKQLCIQKTGFHFYHVVAVTTSQNEKVLSLSD